MRTRPEDYPAIFGQYFAKRNNQVILAIGKRTYTRYDLGAIGCPHPHAPFELHKVIKQLNITSIEDLVKHHSPSDFVGIKGFGPTAFYALVCVLRDARVDIKSFYRSKVTVGTLAIHARKKTSKRRRRAA